MNKIINLNNLFLLVVFFAPLYLIRVSFFGVPSNVFELLAISAIALTALKERSLLLKKTSALPKLFSIGLLLILMGVLSSLFSNTNQLAGLGILKGWFLIPMFFSFTLYLYISKSKTDVERVFWSVYLSSSAVGIIAIAYKLVGIVTYDNRLNAFYLSPNHLAMYLAPGVFFGLYFLLKSATQQQGRTRESLLHACLLSTLLISLYYTYSYGAWVAILISLSVVFLLSNKSKKNALVFFSILFLLAVLLFSLQLSTDKFSTLTDFSSRSSFTSRQTIWQASLLMLKESPIVGIGPGNFQQAYLSLQPSFAPYLEWAVPQPHNIFLAFWLQSGLIGLIGFLMLLFFIFHTLWQKIKNKSGTAFATPLLGFFLYTILHGLIDTPYWKNDLAFLFWLCAFIALTLLSPGVKGKNYN